MDEFQVLASGNILVGDGIRSIGQVLTEKIRGTKKEVSIVTYNIGQQESMLLPLLENCLRRGILVTIIYNKMDTRSRLTKKLIALSSDYENLRIYEFSKKGELLHAKIFVFDLKEAIIGSANFSSMAMINNHELGVLIRGKKLISVVEAVSRLQQKSKKISSS